MPAIERPSDVGEKFFHHAKAHITQHGNAKADGPIGRGVLAAR